MEVSRFNRHMSASLAFSILLCLAAGTVNCQDVNARIVYHVPGMENVKSERDIVYRSDAGSGCTMDVYSPPGTGVGATLPVIIFIHGGFLPRDMKPLPKEWGVFRSYGELAAASGMIGVTFNHRYHGWDRADLDTSFGDVSAAIRFVRSNAPRFHADPDRICLWAFSGGGPHLCVPFREGIDGIRCLVSYYAILDIRDGAAQQGVDTAGGWLRGYVLSTYLSPADSHFPPMLIARAGLDNPGLNASVDRFLASAFRTNETVELLTVPDGVHGFDIFNDNDRSKEVIARTIQFVRTNLGRPVERGDARGHSAGKLYAMILNGDLEGAKRLLGAGDSTLARNQDVARITSEGSLNTTGYWLLSAGSVQAAIDVFRWVVEIYPRSPNAYDSLGDAYVAAGRTDLAAENARKALKLLDAAPGLNESQRNKIKRSAESKLGGFR
jgi:hypothetical protein